MLKLGGNESPTKEDVTTALEAVGIEADAEALDMMYSELEGKDVDEIITMGRAKLASFGSGGGGGGGAGGGGAAGGAEEAKEEEKEEEEEEEIDMCVVVSSLVFVSRRRTSQGWRYGHVRRRWWRRRLLDYHSRKLELNSSLQQSTPVTDRGLRLAARTV